MTVFIGFKMTQYMRHDQSFFLMNISYPIHYVIIYVNVELNAYLYIYDIKLINNSPLSASGFLYILTRIMKCWSVR